MLHAPLSHGGREMPPWVAGYVGLRWKVLGRSRDGLDCYGLVRLVLAERFGIALPALDGGWGAWPRHDGAHTPQALDTLATFVSGSARACCVDHGWHELHAGGPQGGDVAQFLLHGRPIHVGLVVGHNWFLHVRDGANSAVERLDSRMWRNRLVCLYRHGSLA
ncbi:MAG: C40 family peptidase [Fimbriimonadaceae bacterium]|nr:C40 family peptidase [Fimbriimonadaceae bacterium]